MMKITNLNIDCLEAILNHLEFQDLINAADSNRRINHAAKFVFSRKYSRNMIVFEKVKNMRIRLFEFNNEEIHIYDLKFALILLRCFGCVMNEIKLTFIDTVHYQYVTCYISEFCADSITKIHISSHRSIRFEKPFTKIENVSLIFPGYPDLSELLGGISLEFSIVEMTNRDWLIRFFPKMKHLEVENLGRCTENRYIVNHFPYLESLNIYHGTNFNGLNGVCTCVENIMDTLKLNSHIKKLRIRFRQGHTRCFNAKNIQSVEECLQNLESLVLIVTFEAFFHEFNFQTINFKSLKNMAIQFFSNQDYNATTGPYDFPFNCDQLEVLTFHVKFADYFNKFIERHPTISTVNVMCSGIPNIYREVTKMPSVPNINFKSRSEINLLENQFFHEM